MIRVNLLKTGPQTQLTIPFGWIFVAFFAALVCLALFVLDQQNKAIRKEESERLAKIEKDVRALKNHWNLRKSLKEQVRSLERDYTRYEALLSKQNAGWTPTLLLFEDLLVKARTVWFRDVRIDGDGRVMINAISMQNKDKKRMPGITRLYSEIKNQPTRFKSVRLKRINKDKEQRQPVSRFELNCVIIR
jgi:hypothetical protein